MKSFFVNYLVLAALVATAAFTSCNKDDDKDDGGGKITATVENGSKYDNQIVKVKLVSMKDDSEIASGSWSKGGFTIVLPATVDAKYLDTEDEDDYGEGVTVSNKNAKTVWFDIYGYDKDDKYVTSFGLGKSDDSSESYAWYVYSDGDVNISGTEEEEYEYDGGHKEISTYSVTLKKGWNVVYDTHSESTQGGKRLYNGTLTSTPVSGLKWYSDEDF